MENPAPAEDPTSMRRRMDQDLRENAREDRDRLYRLLEQQTEIRERLGEIGTQITSHLVEEQTARETLKTVVEDVGQMKTKLQAFERLFWALIAAMGALAPSAAEWIKQALTRAG